MSQIEEEGQAEQGQPGSAESDVANATPYATHHRAIFGEDSSTGAFDAPLRAHEPINNTPAGSAPRRAGSETYREQHGNVFGKR